jgi:outer membrane lipoprotein SlyB
MENIIRVIFILILMALTAGGCASSMSPDTYTRSQARQVQTVDEGEVIYVREVMIE